MKQTTANRRAASGFHAFRADRRVFPWWSAPWRV